MDDAARAAIEAACRRLVLQAAAAVDDREPDRLAALFVPDGVLRRPSAEPLLGREAIRAAYRARPADRLTRHLVTNVLVEIASPTEARARSYVLLWSGTTTDPVDAFGRPMRGSQVVGEFDDAFVSTPEGWRLASREARFVLHAG